MHGRYGQRVWEHRGGSGDSLEEVSFEPDFEEWGGGHLWVRWLVLHRGNSVSKSGMLVSGDVGEPLVCLDHGVCIEARKTGQSCLALNATLSSWRG